MGRKGMVMKSHINNPKELKPLLLGIVVDISGSMSENWNNREGKGISRISSVRAAIDNRLHESVRSRGQGYTRDIEIFCLGLGFKCPMHLVDEKLAIGYRPHHQVNNNTILQIDLVCDLLALVEIVPTREEMQNIELALNSRWNEYARNALQYTDVGDDVYENLRSYIREALFISAHSKLRGDLLFRIHSYFVSHEGSFKDPLRKWLNKRLDLYVEYWKDKISKNSFDASHQYLDRIQRRAEAIFAKNKPDYEKYIEDRLADFIFQQSDMLLNLLATGYEQTAILGYFEEQNARDLAKKIYTYLDNDVRDKIRSTWFWNKVHLLFAQLELRGFVAVNEIDRLTELCVRRYGWNILEPFVRGIVHDLFAKSFKNQVIRMIPYWLSISAGREVIRSIEQINRVFPDVYEQDFYSRKFMFGSTPVEEALYKASMRFTDIAHREKEKVLIIISDGEFETTKPMLISRALKQVGVRVVTCCVIDRNLVQDFVFEGSNSWPEGAKILLEMASLVEKEDVLVKYLKEKGLELSEGVKMFYQINHSRVLEDVIDAVLKV
jgi:hypothetical protein